jgi:drug/metabolite transporter (DMT)-like permease
MPAAPMTSAASGAAILTIRVSDGRGRLRHEPAGRLRVPAQESECAVRQPPQSSRPVAPDTISRTMGLRDWGLLFALSALWGGSFFFVGVAVRELPPLSIVTLRVGTAALVLLAIVHAAGLTFPTGRTAWAAFLGMGLLNNVVPFCLIVWGQGHIASSLASILNATTPLFTVLVAHFLTADEKLTPGRVAGVVIGFAGVVLMLGPEALAGLGTDLLAQVACLAAALSYAFAGIWGRRFRRLGIAPLPTAAGQVVASTLLLSPITLAVEQPWTLAAPGAKTWAAIVGLAVLSTAAGYVLYFRLLASAGATNLLLVTFLIPVSAILLGAGILGDTLAPRHFIGMGFIGAGLAAIAGRLAAKLSGRATGRS